MLVSCAIALAAMTPAPTVSDYFPLTPGLVRTFEVTLDSRTSRESQEVGRKVLIEGKQTTMVTQKLDGAAVGSVYYGIEGDTLFVLATSTKELLKKPIPVLKVGDKTVKWDFDMESPVLPPQALVVQAASTPKGKRKVLGVDRDVLEVTYAVETPKGAPVVFKSRQTVVYAAGIGVVDWDEETTVGKTITKKKMKLLRVETPPTES